MLTKSGLQLGLGLPQDFINGRDIGLLRRFAQRAEVLGFDDLWVVESVISRNPVLEAITTLSYVAALTERIRLGTSVLVTNLRNPVELAKQLSSLDNLCDGRLIAGIGLGTDTKEYETFGVPTERHVTRFVEGIGVMKALWTEKRATRESPLWPLDGVPMEPKPVQANGIPIWIGARAPEALRRAVDLADGWMGAGSSSISDYIGQQGTMRAILAERGITPGVFPISKRVYMAIDSDRERARERMRTWVGQYYGNPDAANSWAVTGTVEDVAAVLNKLREGGATHLMLHPPFDHEQQLEIIARELAPRL